MVVSNSSLMCVGKPAPRPYNVNGTSGISYKIELSDGSGTVTLPVSDEAVYQLFEPWHMYHVDVEITQSAMENRIVTRSRVIAAVETGEQI